MYRSMMRLFVHLQNKNRRLSSDAFQFREAFIEAGKMGHVLNQDIRGQLPPSMIKE